MLPLGRFDFPRRGTSYGSKSRPSLPQPASQVKLGDVFYEEWSRELFQGPFLEALPRYEGCHSLSNGFLQLAKRGENPDRFWLLSVRQYIVYQRTNSRAHSVGRLAPRGRLLCVSLAGQDQSSTLRFQLWPVRRRRQFRSARNPRRQGKLNDVRYATLGWPAITVLSWPSGAVAL
jgi:hypothetical protein